MLGRLPMTLLVSGREYPIQTDYRNILPILQAANDPDYTPREQLYIMLKRLYREQLDFIPKEHQAEAAGRARWFIDCGREDNEDPKPPVRLIDWEQDEPLLFPAVNQVAGTETRSVPDLHWWTFMGYFMEIGGEGLFSTVLSIRQKKAKRKKLEKHEMEFYRNNKAMCDIKKRYTMEEQAEIERLKRLFG